jgi:hypothetical protein
MSLRFFISSAAAFVSYLPSTLCLLQARKRTKLALPEPQVSDAELAEIAKSGAMAALPDDGDGSSATNALIGTYGNKVAPTPLQTPRLPASQDVIMEEARNILALNAAPTPLKVWSSPRHPSTCCHILRLPHLSR